jgi:hypothetical protein
MEKETRDSLIQEYYESIKKNPNTINFSDYFKYSGKTYAYLKIFLSRKKNKNNY